MADKSRRMHEPRHIRLYHEATGSDAWRNLSGNAIKVLVAICRLLNRDNNGELYFSDRTGAAATGLSRNTVRKSLNELMDKGLIACTKPGSFHHKQLLAAQYRVTWLSWPGGRPASATHDYRKWKPQEKSRAQNLMEMGSNFGTGGKTQPPPGSKIEPSKLEKSLVSTNPQMSEIEPQLISHGLGVAGAGNEHRKRSEDPNGPFLDTLRDALRRHLEEAGAGSQTALANALHIPGGTLSKFLAGRGLSVRHAQSVVAFLSPSQPSLAAAGLAS